MAKSFRFEFVRNGFSYKFVGCREEPATAKLTEDGVCLTDTIRCEDVVRHSDNAELNVYTHFRNLTDDDRKDIINTARKYFTLGFAKLNGKVFTWREVFDCKKHYGHISEIAPAAKDAGYEYFLWNDRVYSIRVMTEGDYDWKDTDYTVNNIL